MIGDMMIAVPPHVCRGSKFIVWCSGCYVERVNEQTARWQQELAEARRRGGSS